MKKINLLGILMALVSLTWSCTSDEFINTADTEDHPGEGTVVNFSFSTSSAKLSRSINASNEEKEKTVNSLYAVVFKDSDGNQQEDDNDVYHGYFKADVSQNGTQYDCSFRMNQSGDYVICFIANPNDAFVSGKLGSLTKGTSTVSNFKNLDVEQDPEEFFMTSSKFYSLNLGTISRTTTISNVTMKRAMARVDVKNSSDGLDVTAIEFYNRGVKSTVYEVNATTVPGYYATNVKTYSPSSGNALITGNSVNPDTYGAEIYTYEQYNTTDSTTAPYLKVYCNLGTTGLKDTLTVYFRKKVAIGDWTYIPLKRNNKYTVNLKNNGNKISFNLTVEDWQEGTTFEVTPDELAGGDNVTFTQAQMNAKLKVAKLFTDFNVASINGSIVTFETTLNNAPAQNSYYTYTAAKALNNLQDSDGNLYRLPTEGELNLLLPMYTETSDRATVNKSQDGMYYPYWNDNSNTNTFPYVIVSGQFTEIIYLKNDQDGYPDTGETDENYVISGNSWLKKGASVETVSYNGNPYNIAPVYGLRFQGTSQYAAYRWESCKIASEPSQRYLSIKIKALKKDDTSTSITDVADESFWTDGYIEFKFPASGYYTTSGVLSFQGILGFCWSSSLWSGSPDGSLARYLSFFLDYAT